MAQLAKSMEQKEHIDEILVELGHHLDLITHATGRATGFHLVGFHLTSMFNPFEDYALGKAKKVVVS